MLGNIWSWRGLTTGPNRVNRVAWMAQLSDLIGTTRQLIRLSTVDQGRVRVWDNRTAPGCPLHGTSVNGFRMGFAIGKLGRFWESLGNHCPTFIHSYYTILIIIQLKEMWRKCMNSSFNNKRIPWKFTLELHACLKLKLNTCLKWKSFQNTSLHSPNSWETPRTKPPKINP